MSLARKIQISGDARNQLMEGIDILAKVVKVTLGPGGRNVVLDKDFGYPQVCSDGVTIAREIVLPEPFENMGVQLLNVAAIKTNDVVGDGTTTSVILAHSIVQQGFKNIVAGASPMGIKRGIEKAVDALRQEIENMATPVVGRDQIAQVAVLSSHDEEMGELLADVLDKIGREGVVTVEESKGLAYEVEYVEGMWIDRGWLSPYLVTDPDRMVMEVEEPYVLCTIDKMSAVSDLVPFLDKFSKVSRNLVIISEDVIREALALLVVNKLKGNLTCLPVRAPFFGDRRKAKLEDLAVLFGATVISKEAGRTLDSIEISDLGRCRRAIANKDDTTFIGGNGTQEAIDARIEQIRMQIEQSTSAYDIEKMEERIASLVGGVCVLKVGASTEIELREKKQRLEDALSATRAAMEEGIVPGGGTTLVRAAQAVRDKIDAEGDERTGVDIVLSAVEAPVQLIAENAGYPGQVILEGVKNGKDDWGYDAQRGQFGSMFEMGIVDPAKVARSALENGASVAGMVLTSESLITDAKPAKLPAPYND